MMNLPLVSVVITSYNRSQWVGQAIESALAQDYPNLEIIISDNCSTDNSDEVIKKYSHDQRIRYSVNEKNIGMIPNLQKAFFELAKGEYITNISSDDYLVNPGFIKKAIDIIKRNENISVVFSINSSINDKTKIVIPNSLEGKYDIECKKGANVFFDFAGNPYYSSAGTVYSVRHMKENDIHFSGWVMGDVELNLQLLLHGNVGFLNELVYTTRVHDNNASGQFTDSKDLADKYLNIYRYIYKKALPFIDKKKLKTWLNKVIDKNIMLCLHMVLDKKNRKELYSFHRLLLKEYRREYLSFLVRHPKYVVKIILNK